VKSVLIRLLIVVAVGLAPMVAFQVYQESQNRELRQRLTEESVQRLVLLVRAEQLRIVDGAEQVLNVVGNAPAVRQADTLVCDDLMRSVRDRTQRYASLGVVDMAGRQICASHDEAGGAELGQASWFRRAVARPGVIVDSYAIDAATNLPVVVVAKAFTGAAGQGGRVAWVAIKLGWWNDQVAKLALPPGASAVVADRDGRFLAVTTRDMPFSIGDTLYASNRFMLEGSTVGFRDITVVTGERRVAAWTPPGLDETGLLVAVGLDPAVSFASVTAQDWAGIILNVSAALLTLGLMLLLATRLIRRPVDQLLAVARRWQDGDMAARAHLDDSGSEFAALGRAFDAMAVAVEDRERAVQTALESTTDIVVVLDRDFRYRYLNSEALASMPPGSQPLGRPVWELFPYLLDHVFGDALRQAMQTGVASVTDAMFPGNGNHWRLHAYPTPQDLTIYMQNTTEERRSADTLRQTERLFQATFEQAALGMGLFGADGTVLRLNDRLCEIMGRTRDEMGTPGLFGVMTHPDDRRADRAHKAAIVAGRTDRISYEKRYLRTDGSAVWVNFTCSTLHDLGGHGKRFMVIIEDITPRKAVETALQDSRARMGHAMAAARLGAVEYDAATGRDHWSAEAAQVFGRAGDGANFDAWLADVHPDDQGAVRGQLAESQAPPGRTLAVDFRFRQPDGSWRWIRSHSRMVAQDGRLTRGFVLVQDVTEDRAMADRLRVLNETLEARVREEIAAREAAQARAMQAERMQALGQLAGGIAHDFNNVLQALKGATQVIQRRPSDVALVERMATLAATAIDRGASITGRLLTLGRRGALSLEPVDVRALLQGLQEILTHTLGRGVAVRLALQASLAPVLADRAQLETVLVNLATNGRDAMPNGGELVFAARDEVVGPDAAPHHAGLAPGSYVRLSLSDMGEGMDAPTLARAGEPFFTTKGTGVGTGLGLAMARSFAEASGGALDIASRPGEGTTVTLWLPRMAVGAFGAAGLAGPAARPREVRPGERAGAGAARILLVDDEALVREVIARQLADAGFEVLTAASGEVALALAATERLDAMVCDLSMPGMDGLAVIRAMQQRLPGLPTLLLTGFASDESTTALNGMMNGATGAAFSLLRKPVGESELVDQLCALLEGATVAAD